VISRKLLDQDEFVVVSTRTHLKALLVPAVALILLAAAAGFLSTLPAGNVRFFLQWVIWGVALLAILWLVVRPFLTWLATTYTLTNRRLITRSGLLTRRGHDIVLTRINDVSYERSLMDRMLGCGTLYIQTAAEGAIVLDDVPDVERVHVSLTELIFGTARRGPTGSSPRGQQFGSR